MSLWSKLFGGSSDAGATEPAEVYQDYAIYPEPMQEAGGHRVAARIEKDFDGETKRHQMIRADVCSSPEEAASTAVLKAKSLIDQQGDAIFD